MKSLVRNYLINLCALWVTAKIMPGLDYQGGIQTLLVGAIAFMLINLAVVPLLKVLFLPLNLLTFGIFAWVVNVLALYFLTLILPEFKLLPFTFPGLNMSWLIIPPIDLNILEVAVVCSFMIGFISHFLQWLVKK